MNGFRTIERQVNGEIMSTDILIRIAAADASKSEMEHALDDAFRTLRAFADRFSRFISGNELWRFNESEGGPVSEELYDLLTRAQTHFTESGGYFDPTILPMLEAEGYAGAYQGVSLPMDSTFARLAFDARTHTVRKPREVKVDFGGFGKGYIVDRILQSLGDRYPHVLVDAGGDIAVKGVDIGRGEDCWIIGVEHPTKREANACLLTLSNQAVATSGKNRRHWTAGGRDRHHLIDPGTGQSSASDLLSVSVIAPTCEAADVLAKRLFLMGHAAAQDFAAAEALPTIFFTDDQRVTINPFAQNYVWTTA